MPHRIPKRPALLRITPRRNLLRMASGIAWREDPDADGRSEVYRLGSGATDIFMTPGISAERVLPVTW